MRDGVDGLGNRGGGGFNLCCRLVDFCCLFGKLVGLARGDTDKSVRAVACHASTSLALSVADQEGDAAGKIRSLVKRKLRKALKTVASKDRDEAMRNYAARCLEALDDDENTEFDSEIDGFHKDGELLGGDGDD